MIKILITNFNKIINTDLSISFKTISILYCVFVALVSAQNHNAVDEAIYLKSLLEKNTLFFVDFMTGASIVHQISAFFLKIGISHFKISLILFFITNIIFWFSCANIIKKTITQNSLTILIFLWIITQTQIFNFVNPFYTYPITFSPHLATFSSAVFILAISTLINKSYKKSILISLVNITIHPIIGAFSLLVTLIISLIQKKEVLFLNRYKLYELLPIVFLYIFYFTATLYVTDVKEELKLASIPELYNFEALSYSLRNFWYVSTHVYTDYNWYNYVPILIFSIYFLKLLLIKDNDIFNNNLNTFFIIFIIPIIITLITQLLLSLKIFIIEQYFLERFLCFSNFILRLFFLKFIILAFDNRKKLEFFIFLIIFIFWPFIFSDFGEVEQIKIISKLNILHLFFLIFLILIHKFLKDTFYNNKKFLIWVLFLFTFFMVNDKNLSYISIFSNPKYGSLALQINQNDCPKIEKGSGILVSNQNQYNQFLRSCNLVPFSYATIPDGITYNNKKIYELTEIFKIVYGIDLLNPKLNSKNKKLIIHKELIQFEENIFREIWEKRTLKQWSNISKKYKILYIVAPSKWNINLKKSANYRKSYIYKIPN